MEEGHLDRLTRLDITAFREFASPIFPDAKELVRRIFNEDIQLISNKKGHTLLLERFFAIGLDPGLRREAKFSGEDNLSPVVMLNRSSFLYELRRRVGFKRIGENSNPDFKLEKNFRILTLDLKNLRAADEAVDEAGNSAGDYVLNLAAVSLNESVKKITEELGVDENDILVGRYGGDEFYIGLVGKYNPDIVNQIKAKVKTAIESKQGLYKQDGEIIKANLSIKNDQIGEVNIPTDKIEKELFLSFLQRGLVLDGSEIEKEKEIFTGENGEVDQNRLNAYLGDVLARNIYPKEVENAGDKEKIKYLIENHQELKVPFYLAAHLDQKNQESRQAVRQKALLNFVENYLVDPLLDEIVISRFDLLDHIKRSEFSSIFSFELKLKEINDNLSYSTGDQAIINLWKVKRMLKSILNDEINKIMIGRFAGTIFFGLKKGQKLSNEALENIDKLIQTGVEGQYKGIKFTHSIGFSRIDVSNINPDTEDRIIKEKMGQMFESATDNWLENIFKRLFTDEISFTKFISLLERVDVIFDADIFPLLTARYFTGDRWDIRIARAKKILARLENGKLTEEEKEKIKKVDDVLNQVLQIKNSSR